MIPLDHSFQVKREREMGDEERVLLRNKDNLSTKQQLIKARDFETELKTQLKDAGLPDAVTVQKIGVCDNEKLACNTILSQQKLFNRDSLNQGVSWR